MPPRLDRIDKSSGTYVYAPLGAIRQPGVFNVSGVVLNTPSMPKMTSSQQYCLTIQLADQTTWAPSGEEREELRKKQANGEFLVERPPPAAPPEDDDGDKLKGKSNSSSIPENTMQERKRPRVAETLGDKKSGVWGDDNSSTSDDLLLTVGDALVITMFSETLEGLPGDIDTPGRMAQGDVLRIHRLRVEKWCDDQGDYKLRGTVSKNLGSAWVYVSRESGIPRANTANPTWTNDDIKRLRSLHDWWEVCAARYQQLDEQMRADYVARHTPVKRAGRSHAKENIMSVATSLEALQPSAYVDVVAQVVAISLPYAHQGVVWLWDGTGTFDAAQAPSRHDGPAGFVPLFNPERPLGVVRRLLVWNDHPAYAELEQSKSWAVRGNWVHIRYAKVREYEGVLELKAIDDTEICSLQPTDTAVKKLQKAYKRRLRQEPPAASASASTAALPAAGTQTGPLSLAELRNLIRANEGGQPQTYDRQIRFQLTALKSPVTEMCSSICLVCGKESEILSVPAHKGQTQLEPPLLQCPACKGLIEYFIWDFTVRVRDDTAALDVRLRGENAEIVVGGLPPANLTLARATHIKRFAVKKVTALIESRAWMTAVASTFGLPSDVRNSIELCRVARAVD